MEFRLFYLLFLLTSVLSAPAVLQKPSEDDFYQPPDNYKDAKLGTILKARQVPATVRSVYFPVRIKNAWQLLIRSEDSHGNATGIVTSLFEPYNADPKKLVSYQTWVDSPSMDCAPSYTFLNGGGFNTILTQAEMFFFSSALDQGYYVTSPDYLGNKGTFNAGIQAGKATLDSIKGVLASGNFTGIDSQADTIMWGYSGGSLASGWAASLQPSYAKELSSVLKGAALGGWLTNTTSMLEIIEGSFYVGLTPSSLAGIGNEYPEFNKTLSGLIAKDKLDDFKKVQDMCITPAALHYAFENFFESDDKFITNGWDFFKDPVIKKIMEENTLGFDKNRPIPKIPLFLYHAANDDIVPFKDAQRVYDNWCDQGVESFEFSVSNSTVHITEALEGCTAALAWIKKRFDGGSTVEGCKRTVRYSNLFYPGAFTSASKTLGAIVDNVLGRKIGPNANNFTLAE